MWELACVCVHGRKIRERDGKRVERELREKGGLGREMIRVSLWLGSQGCVAQETLLGAHR